MIIKRLLFTANSNEVNGVDRSEVEKRFHETSRDKGKLATT